MDFGVSFLLLGLRTLLLCAGAGGAGEASSCPLQCVCETRPWYTPQSVYHQARTVDCNELHLQRVPANISSDTQVLLLQSNNISFITAELQSLGNLTELDLSQNHITQVRSIALWPLSRLVTLYLEENRIEELEDFGLTDLSRLEELYLNHNRISSIGARAFAGLPNLLRLHLNSNRLVAVSSRWFESLPSLEILMIGENPILGLEDATFRPLSRLHSLVLARMGLTSVPSAAFRGLRHLESLSFYDNRLRSVPRDALRELPSLKFLDLNRNPIVRIQQGDFQDLQHLEELSLNDMEELLMVERRAFHNLPAVVKLEVSNNPQLSYVHPQAFRSLPSLRTLLLHNNHLGLLSGAVFSSLPSLEEVSLHSNPLRCDCGSSWGAHLGNRSHLKLLESAATLCSSPRRLAGRELREVAAEAGWGGADSCPPRISPSSFPPALNVSAGQPLALECWADAHPAPQLYWVTPAGDKVSWGATAAPGPDGRSRSRKPRISESGVLLLDAAEPSHAGIYSCVAWNRQGADTRSVSVSVGRGREQNRPGNLSAAVSPPPPLLLAAKVVGEQSVVLEWKPLGEEQPYPPRWMSARVHVDNPQISYTAEVPVEAQEYNLTHLLPATEYRVCLSVPPPGGPSSLPGPPPLQVSCVNVTTKEAALSAETAASRRSSVAAAVALASIFALSIMALLAVYISRRAQQQQSCGHSLKKYLQRAASIPLNDLYPPLITLWDNEKDKADKGDEETEVAEEEERAGGSPIDTNKTYVW